MTCPSCSTRKARRACPALRAQICTVCCGTKRLVEIACPADCEYLAHAQAHPPSAVRKQRQRDFEFSVPMLHELPEPAYRLLLVFQDAVRWYRPTALPPLNDADVAEACATLAATLETAGRGIIYEHQAQSLPAQRLVVELRAALESAAPSRTSAIERDAAASLRRIEQAAKTAAARLDGGPVAYLQFLDRVPEHSAAVASERKAEADATGGATSEALSADRPSGLIIPG